MASSISLGDNLMQIDDGSGKLRENAICKFKIFKNTTPTLTIGNVSPDYRCPKYSNLTYPLI